MQPLVIESCHEHNRFLVKICKWKHIKKLDLLQFYLSSPFICISTTNMLEISSRHLIKILRTHNTSLLSNLFFITMHSSMQRYYENTHTHSSSYQKLNKDKNK